MSDQLCTDAKRLAALHTAKELAEMLASRNKGFLRWRARAYSSETTLRMIAGGFYTPDGAREEARKTVQRSLAVANDAHSNAPQDIHTSEEGS